MKVGALIQARMSSTRLPGKVLKDINGRPMISYMIERVRSARSIDDVIVITSLDSSDDPIEEFCKKEGVSCYRGSLDDVLDRYYQASKQFRIDVIARLTGDCPIIDPQIIDAVVSSYIEGAYDFVGNTIPPSWTVPEGMDVEVFSCANLERAWKETKKISDREHVTFYFWQNPDMFSIHRFNIEEDYSRYRLAVDYPNDFQLMQSIITALYSPTHCFSMYDIVAYLDAHPSLAELNQDIVANSGWQSAFDKDKQAGF